MNEARRKRLRAIHTALEEILDEEQEAYDNMPESIQYTEQGEKMENYINAIEEAASNIEEVVEDV